MKLTKETARKVFKSEIASVETMEVRGYKWIETLFCDNSRLGANDEPALTQTQLEIELNRIFKDYPVIYTTIISSGMFQVNLGVFVKVGMATAQRSKLHKALYVANDGSFVRLYETNIIEYVSPGKVRLNSGGYETHTTKKYINHFLDGNSIHQKNYAWYLNDGTEFSNGMVIDGSIMVD